MDSTEALARFLTQLARAADQLAAELMHETAKGGAPQAAILAGLGIRQAQAHEALVAADRDLSTGEIAKRIEYDFSNCYMTMKRLEQLGLVEMVPGAKPQRWRIAS